MNQQQEIVLGIMAIMASAGFAGVCLAKEEAYKILFAFCILISVVFLLTATVTMTNLYEETKKRAEGKCPEYERVENVYRLKDAP